MGGEGAEQRSYPNLLWIRKMERVLHAIMAQIEREMCINFVLLYLCNGQSKN